jgi:rhamnosyltransferase subunit B
MAQFLLMPFGSSGDTNPFVGIGRELKARGHSVTVLVNGYFRQTVERAGLDFVEMGSAEQYLAMLNNPDIWDPRKGFAAVVGNAFMPEAVRAQYKQIEMRFRRDPHLVVVAGSLALGARIAEEKLGVRMTNLHLQPMMFFSVQKPPVAPNGRIPEWMPRSVVRFMYWIVDRHVYGPVIGEIVEPFRSELGLPKTKNYLREWMHGPKLALGLFPKWYAHAPDWPAQLKQTGFPLFDDGADKALSAEVEAYLAQGEPPIVYTFGSGMRRGEKLFAAAAESCERLGRRGILLTPFREQLPAKLSAHATHFDYIPLARLLPKAAAIVHHGGIGTTSQALRAGTPQLVTPLSHDQPDNADRIEKLGVGRMLPSQKATGDTMAAALTALLGDPNVRVQCLNSAQHFKQGNALAETCDVLEQFAKSD